jgi:hypothetical protein
MYLSTHHALPPGGWYLKAKRVRAVIGPFLSAELIAQLSEDRPRSEAERVVTALVEKVVCALRDDEKICLEEEVASLRRARHAAPAGRQAVPVASGAVSSKAKNHRK